MGKASSNDGAGATKAQSPPLLMKQPVQMRMVYALTPLLVAGIYFFGWRVLALLLICQTTGFIIEFIACRRRGKGVSMANFVTCWLLALSLPPTTPFWIAAAGAAVAILFGKEVFGGFGRNIANPAIVGRAFIYVCFPVPITAKFVPVFKGFPGGFAHWSFESLKELPAYLSRTGMRVSDAVSQASPLWVYREYQEPTNWLDLLLGNIGGTFTTPDGAHRILSAGSIGEGCGLLIVLAAVYLLATRTANWRLMLSGLAGVVFANTLFRDILGFSGPGGVPPLEINLLAGTTLYVLVFMVTEPVTAPSKKSAMFAYAFFIGFCIVVLRWRGVFVAAASFSLLLGNLIAPLLDLGAGWLENRKKTKGAAA